MSGKYEQVGSAADMRFLDPSGQYGDVMNQAGNQANQYAAQMGQYAQQATYDPEAYMRAFMGQAEGLSDLVSGQNSQLQQNLNSIAGRQAQLGGEAALAQMPGMRNSGAAMAAYGQAYADPFAQAQAQLQQNQLQGTLSLWNQAMGQYGQQYANQYQQALNQAQLYGQMSSGAADRQAQLLANQSAWYTPQYEYKKGFADYAADAVGLGIKGATAAGGLGWKPFAE